MRQETLNTARRSAVLPIALYPWGGDYHPAAWVQCGMDADKVIFRLWCQEDDRDVPQYHHANDPVSQDSCLETFVIFYPNETKYLNFEVNRAGTMLMEQGTRRGDRSYPMPEDFPDVPFPKAQAFETADGWGVQVEVPVAFVQAIYGTDAPIIPENMRGNFYKCGAVADREHYACWAPVQAPKPDYHRPECFRAFWQEEK